MAEQGKKEQDRKSPKKKVKLVAMQAVVTHMCKCVSVILLEERARRARVSDLALREGCKKRQEQKRQVRRREETTRDV